MALQQALVNLPNPLVNIVHLNKGSHCAGAEVYGEDIFNGIVKDFILSQSPEFDIKSRERQTSVESLNQNIDFSLRPGEKFFGYQWSTHKGSGAAEVRVKIWAPENQTSDQNKCRQWKPYDAFEGCFRSVAFDMPLRLFFPSLATKNPETEAEAQVLTRWLNTRAHLITKDHQEPVDTLNPPETVTWYID